MTTPASPQNLQRGTSALVIARNIRNDIESGRLAHGQQLPSTRALADEWGTSVATINRAMGMLAEEGLVLNRARSSRLVNYPAGVAKRPDGRPRTPKVVLIGGYAGSGKTELGRILARETGWPILDKDTTTRAVVEAALETLGESPHDRESELYLTVIRPAEYNALIATLIENAQCGNSSIVTAPFIRELGDQAWCDRLSANLTSMGAELYVVWVRCDADTMRTYLRHRGAARDAWKLAHWEQYLTGKDIEFRPVIQHQIIDNSAESRPLQQQAAELLDQVIRP
ncbi:hypothetical protein GCM10012275_02410 [Longimycelium tulufanense]|uniref:HTH gntR-type domain-containing protein n=1 Tax=Longimycelium tulufanense TaxID=907463 RepID=A0A8J3C8P0_9PSEU|nr:GntR family transcriptional regulator [Longimycelium tulufanense]GGM34668.1 hypothetical protein GCM10012275_02410 [Longimycelium tulufanense]